MQGCRCKFAAFFLLDLAGLVGCNSQLSPQAEAMLLGGASAYVSGQYDVTVRQMDAFLRDYGGSGRSDEAYYLRGLAKSRQNDVAGARQDLTEAINRARSNELKGKAMVELGEIAFERGETAAAEKSFRAALGHLPQDRAPADVAHYRLACLLQQAGRWGDADGHLSKVLYYFGDTPQGKLASGRIHCRAWTVQTGSFQDIRNAEAMARQLREKRLAVVVENVTRDGRLLHQVQVGRYSTYEQAVAAMDEVRKHVDEPRVIATR